MGNQATREYPERLGHVRVDVRRVGPPYAGRAGRQGDEQHGDRPRAPARTDDVRGLDGSHRGRRRAAGAAAPAGHRAQPRADDVGLGRPGDVRARRADDRQAQPDGQRLRADLRRRLGQRRIPDRRSARAHGDGAAHSGARSDGAAGQGAGHAGAVAVLGRQALLVRPCDHEPRGDGRQRPRVDVVAVPPARESAGLLRNHPSAALAPQESSFRQVQYFDPKTRSSSRSTSASTRTTCSSRPTRTRRSTATASSAARSAGSTRGSSTRRATKRPRRAGAAVPRHRRQRQDRSRRRPLRVRAPRAVDRPARRHANSGRRDLQRHPASDRRQRLGRRAGPMPGRSSASIRRPASARPTSRRSIPAVIVSATRRAASTSIRTA